MENKILTPSARAAAEFDKRIQETFRRLIEEGFTRVQAYDRIADIEGCGRGKVYSHLKTIGAV